MASRKKTRKVVPQGGGDVITVNNRGNSNAIAAGRGARAVVSQGVTSTDMDTWRNEMGKRIDAVKGLLPADKADLKENVAKVAEEVSKEKKADLGRLERLLNVIGGMAPEILDVAMATLANPLAGLGLVAKKIGEKAKLEQQTAP